MANKLTRRQYQANRNRADRAQRILVVYAVETLDTENVVRDLLADLMHLSSESQSDFNFSGELEIAKQHFDAEANGED